MRPKNPTPKLPGTPHRHPDTPHPLPIPRSEPPVVIRPGGPDIYQSDRQRATLPPPDNQLPTVHIHDLSPSVRESGTGPTSDPRSTESIRHYELPPQTRTLLPDVITEGLRVHRGRIYAEVQYTTTGTVMVAWDESLGTYRAMFPQEAQPSGPALHFDPASNTWRVGEPQKTPQTIEQQIHRPADNTDDTPAQIPASLADSSSRTQSNTVTAHIDTRHYIWDNTATNHHGYVVMHRKMRLDDSVGPLMHHAFMDDNGSFISVEPSAPRIDQPAELLPAWTDRDIWDLYGLQGAEITRFRTEADRTGRKPQWAKVREQRLENAYLYDELRRWLGPEMDRDMFNRLLEHQRLTPAKWAEHLESVTLHRSTPDTQTPLPGLPRPETPEHHDTPTTQTPSPRLPPPATPETTDTTPAYGDQSYYTWDLGKTNFHGYVEMQRKPGLDDSHGPLVQVAFRDGIALTIVKPTGYPLHKETALRPFWRDVDIWNLYRIEGKDIARFRQDVAIHGIPPTWVNQRKLPSRREQLIEYLRMWTNPDSPLKSKEQVIARFRPYNLSILQLARLCKELSPSGQFKHRINDELPEWATSHQARSRIVTNPKLFDPFLPELHTEMIRLRNQGQGTSILKESLSEPFFRELLTHGGFKHNRHNYLYRTDIPAVFTVDNRTPSEIARPATMVPQTVLSDSVTSEVPVSVMFSLKTAMDLANATARPNNPQTGSESHPESNVNSTPPIQRIRFCYLLDTRNLEVVPGQENRAYHSARTNRSLTDGKTWFPSMKMEGHLSTSPIGFSSRRIWLVNSAMTHAAPVEDVHLRALVHANGSNQSHVDIIEARTKAGDLNQNDYDALIDELAKAGKRVLELPTGKDVFSNDIVFPPETITL